MVQLEWFFTSNMVDLCSNFDSVIFLLFNKKRDLVLFLLKRGNELVFIKISTVEFPGSLAYYTINFLFLYSIGT